MSNVKSGIFSVMAMLAAALLTFQACDDGGGDDKIDLMASIPDPVLVQVGLQTGSMTFDFIDGTLYTEDTTELMQLLSLNVITLAVTNDDNGVSYELTDGTYVNAEVEAPGEYTVELHEDGQGVIVSFYNWFDDTKLNEGGNYTAAVDVAQNDYFKTQTFTRAVTVE